MTQIVSNMIQAHVFRKTSDGDVEFLLLQRAEDEPVYPLMWQAVTGYQHDGETATETARREIHEETGLHEGTLYAVPLIGSFYHARMDAVCMVPVFALEVPGDALVRLSEEHRDFVWMRYDEALRRLPVPSHRDGIRVLKTYLLDAGANPKIFLLE